LLDELHCSIQKIPKDLPYPIKQNLAMLRKKCATILVTDDFILVIRVVFTYNIIDLIRFNDVIYVRTRPKGNLNDVVILIRTNWK
jgi:hypothetical protein